MSQRETPTPTPMPDERETPNPLPDKYHGLQDQEVRYRQRYVDLIVNEETRNTFILRSKIIDCIRSFMNARM